MSNGPTHAMCNVERDFTFDPKVLAWFTPHPPLEKNQMVSDESLYHLEHVFCHESQIKELFPLLCCHVVLIK
jgi:hypothetical protein